MFFVGQEGQEGRLGSETTERKGSQKNMKTTSKKLASMKNLAHLL